MNHADIIVKAYPVTEDQLDSLGTITRDAAVLFAVGGGFFGFALDLTKDMALAEHIPAESLAFFGGISAISWVVAVVTLSLGIVKWWERGAKIVAIKQAAIFSK